MNNTLKHENTEALNQTIMFGLANLIQQTERITNKLRYQIEALKKVVRILNDFEAEGDIHLDHSLNEIGYFENDLENASVRAGFDHELYFHMRCFTILVSSCEWDAFPNPIEAVERALEMAKTNVEFVIAKNFEHREFGYAVILFLDKMHMYVRDKYRGGIMWDSDFDVDINDPGFDSSYESD